MKFKSYKVLELVYLVKQIYKGLYELDLMPKLPWYNLMTWFACWFRGSLSITPACQSCHEFLHRATSLYFFG